MNKQNLLIFALTVVLAVFISCNKKDIVVDEPTTTIKVDNYAYLGNWHNDFLFNAKKETENIDDMNPSKDEAMDILLKININYAQGTMPKGMEFSRIKEDFKELSHFSNEKYLAERTFLPKELRSTSVDDGLSLFDMISLLKKEGFLSSFSESLLLDLTNNLKLNYEKNLSDYEMKQIILDLSRKFDSHGFPNGSEEGEMIGNILAISKASVECWEKNPDLMPSDRKIAPWVASDIAGAAVGAVSGAVGSYLNNGRITAGGVGYGALAGAVVASTGVVGKISKFIHEIF